MRGFISAAMVAFAASGSVANARLAHGTYRVIATFEGTGTARPSRTTRTRTV